MKGTVKQYIHLDKKRSYNPPVGLVTSETDMESPKMRYSYDPHIDPSLLWSGKQEEVSFDVDTVSLHVPLTIIEKFLKKKDSVQQTLLHYFETSENNPPLRDAIHFYKHSLNWSNRLIAGDSLLVMNSLLQKEGMTGKVQMLYVDPPYGIKYGSNFQPFINRQEVKDGKDEDLTQEPEMVKAFQDTWELGVHSFLSYLRDRFLLGRELLAESGSIFVQISDDNIHLVRCILDEIFGADNFVSIITFRKKNMPFGAAEIERMSDYIIWYSKNKQKMKYHRLFEKKSVEGASRWDRYQLPDGSTKRMNENEWKNNSLLPKGSRIYTLMSFKPSGFSASQVYDLEFEGKTYKPPYSGGWTTTKEGMKNLIKQGRVEVENETLRYRYFLDDYPVSVITNLWADTTGPPEKLYVVQTMNKVIQRCMLMATDPGDLVIDPTCGSGTTAYVAEQWGRRWITCDTSRVAIAIARQRLMTASYDYYEMSYPDEGVASGFKYKTVAHITLGSIANNEPTVHEILYDGPYIDKSKVRISGPFTVEAVPSPVVKSLEQVENVGIDESLSREGETARYEDWRMKILQNGVRGKGGNKLEFSSVEPFKGTKWLHADGVTGDKQANRVVFSFGPQYHPLDQTQVELAIEEARNLIPRPKIIIFAAFQFDPEAAKDIDKLDWPGHTILKAQMNTDLLTKDLKKKRSSNESFWYLTFFEINSYNMF